MAERYGKGNVERIGRLWVLHLRGTAFERGLQQGTLMRYRILDTINFYRNLPDVLSSRVTGEGSITFKALKRLKRVLVKRLTQNRDSESLDEMRGLAVGLGMGPEELAEVFVLADALQVAGAFVEKRRRHGPPVIPGMSCTSAVRESPSGDLLVGRNFDFWGAGYWDANPAIIFHHPDKGKSFCSVSTAGFPASGVTSMNEDGLYVAVHQHGSIDSSPKGTPIIDIAHAIVRTASDVDEAIGIAGKFKPIGGWSLVLAGGYPPKAAVLEASSARQSVRFPEEGVLVATNMFRDPELGERELQSNFSATLSNYSRFDRSCRFLSSSRVSPARIASLLGDHFDVYAGRDRSAGFSISRISNISSAVFSLPDKRFWVSESPAPTSKGGYVGFDFDASIEGRTATIERVEGGRPPAKKITSSQERYLEVYKEYVDSGDLSRMLQILGDCSSLDSDEPTFPLMEGIVRCIAGNLRGAHSSINRSLELENVDGKEYVGLLWKARVLDLMDRRDRSVKIYSRLLEDPGIPGIIANLAQRGRKKPFSGKKLDALLLDFTNGDTFE